MFCARDHFGFRLLFYATVGNCLIFCNTLDCLRLYPGVSDKLNDLAIAEFLLFVLKRPHRRHTRFEKRRIDMNPSSIYVRVWEFISKTETNAEFENLYGPNGEWVQLFRHSKAYLGTEFFRDCKVENRYLTLDYFVSEAAFDDFLREFLQEYQALDRRCDHLCQSEREIGTFTHQPLY